MEILVVEDDAVTRSLLGTILGKWGHEVVFATDGRAALDILEGQDPPRLALLDWMVPEVDGVEVCRRVRATPNGEGSYLILLTAKGRPEDLVEGLEAGADDYLVKPFHPDELRARIRSGLRVLALQRRLAERVQALEDLLAQVKQLQGLLPICSYCKKIRDDQDYWEAIETYLAKHSGAQLSHSVCPSCFESIVRPQLDSIERSHRQAKEPRSGDGRG